MATMGVLKMTTPDQLVPMIIPTVMIPLTIVSVAISVVASFIAGLFGIQLKLEGPRKLLELLLKPKILVTAFVLNILILGGFHGIKWWKNYPKLLSTIEREMNSRTKVSGHKYTNVETNQSHFYTRSESVSLISDVEQKWKIETGAGAFRSAIVSNGRVFSGNKLGVISELDIQTGELLRTFYTGTMVSPRITIWNNYLYVGEGTHDTHHARVYRFNLKSGKLEGHYQTLGHTEGQAIIATYASENTLFVVSGSDGLHAVDPVTMKPKWHYNSGHMDAAVVADSNGLVYLGTGREKGDDSKNKTYAAAIDFKTGEEKWKIELPASSWMRPVIVKEDVCYITGEIYFPSKRGHIVCLNKLTGEHTAGIHTTEPLVSTPKALDGSILYTSMKGKVCRFDISARRNMWCFNSKIEGTSFAGAAFDERTNSVVYPSINKGLFVLNANNGKVIFHWNPKDDEGEWKDTYADVTIKDGLWLVSDYSGNIRALKAKTSPKTSANK